MSKIGLLNACNITTGKLDSNAFEVNGIYPFFTCAPEPLTINTYAFDENAILLAGNNAAGKFHCQRYIGKFNAYQRTYVITAKEGYDIDYVYYNLKLNLKNLAKISQGSQTKFLTMKILESFMLEDIPYDEQKNMVEILSQIDNKIDNNNDINAELEAIAKTIYDYWFLQFEFPNEEGKPYKSSGGKMIWNEELKREIPEGWKVDNLEKIIRIIRGVAYNTDNISHEPKEEHIPLLKSNNLQNGKLVLDDIIYVHKNNVSDDQYLNNNSIFVTMSSGSTEHVGKTAIISYDMPFCYGAFCSKIEISPEYRAFISLFFTSEYFAKKIRTIVVGTSIKNINNSHLINNLLSFPPRQIAMAFEQLINPIFDKMGEIIKENEELTSIRDFLLPLLINRQVVFKE